MGTINRVRREIYRKLVHLALCSVLALPYFAALPPPLTVQVYYALGLLSASLLNSVVVKHGKLLAELEKLRRNVDSFAGSLSEELRQPLVLMEQTIARFYEFVSSQISILERDYEKREGYVGLLYGMIGASVSLLLSPCFTLYGVLALALVDTSAALTDLLLGTGQKTARGSAVAFLVYASVLVALGVDPLRAAVSSLLTCIAEYLSPEDNLTVPVVATTLALLLGLPPRCPLS